MKTENDIYERGLILYLNEGINYTANTIKNADVEDLKQLASDSFHAGANAEHERMTKEIEKLNKMLSRYRLKVEIMHSGELDMVNT